MTKSASIPTNPRTIVIRLTHPKGTLVLVLEQTAKATYEQQIKQAATTIQATYNQPYKNYHVEIRFQFSPPAYGVEDVTLVVPYNQAKSLGGKNKLTATWTEVRAAWE